MPQVRCNFVLTVPLMKRTEAPAVVEASVVPVLFRASEEEKYP